MIKSKDILEKWNLEKRSYEDFGESLIKEMVIKLNENAINPDKEYRIKNDISLIKKMFRKNKPYEDIHDKVGGRIIVQFFEQLNEADKIITEYYGDRIIKRENKAEEQSDIEFGYQSIHYDISSPNGTMFCEIQLRTICQHNWSLMSHYLSYKKDTNIPLDIRRQINALSAMFEISDRHFQSIRDSISKLEDDHILRIKRFIENYFFKNMYVNYDKDITENILKSVVITYNNEKPLEKLREFISNRNVDLQDVISKNQDNIFFTQPEIIVILERLENKMLYLKEQWAKSYPIEYLEEIAIIWGRPLE